MTSKIASAVVALVAWTGLVIQFYVTQTHPNLQDVSPFERTLRFFEYFTILTNLLVAVSSTIPLVMPSTAVGRFFSRTSTRTAVAVYIVLVGLVYNAILANLHEFTGAAMVADMVTHDVVPILYFVYWLVFVQKSGLVWMMPFAWLSYPIAYVGYALVRGASTGRYPYPFLSVIDLGVEAVLFNSVLLAAVFFLIGEAFVGIGMLIIRFFPRSSERSQ
jgi:hypothetical protein